MLGQARDELGAFDRSAVQQTIAAVGVRRDRERVAGGIRERDDGMLLHAEVAARRRLAVERRREHAVLDRHALGPTVDQHVEPGALPRRDELPQLVHGQLDRRGDAADAAREQLGRGVLVEAVHRVVGDDVPA